MFYSWVCSGTLYDLCFAIKLDEGDFSADQVALLNERSNHRHGITAVNSSHYYRTGNIFIVTTPHGGIPCDPEEKLRRSYDIYPPRFTD